MTVSFTWPLTAPASSFWSDLEDAVRAFVLEATGLPDDRVYFAHQSVRISEQVARVTIDIDGPFQVGQDGNTHNFDEDREPGEEIEIVTHGNREIVIKLQAFAPLTVGAGVTARSLLDLCQIGYAQSSKRYALNQAGVGILKVGDVVRLPVVRGGENEDRAVLDTRGSITRQVAERTGYWDTVVLTPTLGGS